MWAVGEGGTILYYDGVTWTSQTSGTTEDLLGLWGTSASDIWAVGRRETVLRYDGSIWEEVSVPVP